MKKLLSTLFFLTAIYTISNAQSEQSDVKKSIFKVNLTGLTLNNYGFQFEQVLKKRLSVAVAYRTMPLGKIPFKTQIINQSTDPIATRDALNALKFGNSATTAEIRIYAGKKGYGRGFYVAPFYRNGKFKGEGISFDYTNSANTTNTITLSGELKGNTVGLLLGSQWSLGKYICLDWWIIGPHYGTAKGLLSGKSSAPLSQQEQTSLSQELANFDVPFTKESYVVNANGTTIKLDGPWGGLRAGILLGIKF